VFIGGKAMNLSLFEKVYQVVVKRENTFDGIYYTGIKTTKIVCRPSCKSRLPKKENVLIFQSVEEAITAGFRPCKRCKPEELGKWSPDKRMIEEIKNFIQNEYHQSIALEDLSAHFMISPYHLQRLFKRITGTTPAQFLLAVRINKAKYLLQFSTKTIAQISNEVGFSSSSHFSMVFKKHTSLQPTEYRMKNKKAEEFH
jgi:AraC family transcriptional regulator of adaptative response / methylphosphotriester-DNA alkyltransferase methyltransferase